MPTFTKWIRHLGETARDFFAPTYRPERHYMRGAGPACAARNQPRAPSF